MRGRLWPILLAALGLPLPQVAHAWTDSRVETVRADVHLHPDASANIDLAVHVRVRGGWLEGLEIAGLDPNLQDPSVEFRSENGERFRPTLTQREGRIYLRFQRRSSPRRGRYIATLHYRSDLAAGAQPSDDRVRVSWTLPGWQAGLDGVEIAIHAPIGSRFPEVSDHLATIERTTETQDGKQVLRWRRAHLPRTLPWTVAVDAPREALEGFTEAQRLARGPAQPPARAVALHVVRGAFGPPVGAVLVGLFAWLAVFFFRRAAQLRRATPRPWIPLPFALRTILITLLTTVAATLAYLGSSWICIGLLTLVILLAGQRRAERRAPGLGRWRPVTQADLAAARRPTKRALPWADGTTAVGSLVWLTGAVVLAGVHGADVESSPFTAWLWAMLPLPLWCATRHRLPLAPEARLAAVVRLASQLRAPVSPAIALTLHEGADGQWHDARIRLITVTRPPGLLRLDIALGDDDVAYGVLLTREHSEGEKQAASFTDAEALRGPGGRVVRVVSIHEALALALRFRPPRKKARKVTRQQGRNRHRLRPPAAPLH